MTCPICAWLPDDPDYLLVYENPIWRVILAPNQYLLGRCVIHLKRHCGDLAGMTSEEVLDWLNVVKIMETALQKAFNATMFNWSCYMNLSYREKMPDPHIHWWIVPRYNHAVQIGSLIFADSRFGSPYDHEMWREIPKEVRKQIVERLQEAMEDKLSTD